ncbi:hypothetical protein QPK87_28640 [Kamptonema cortianum]|nr:hypothetical protein [Kamptonema cortianum]
MPSFSVDANQPTKRAVLHQAAFQYTEVLDLHAPAGLREFFGQRGEQRIQDLPHLCLCQRRMRDFALAGDALHQFSLVHG